MFRSIRVTLLFWYAVVLLGAMAVLGTVLHREMRSLLYREADAQLAHWAGVLQRATAENGGAGAAQLERAAAALPATASFAWFDAAGHRLAASLPAGTEPPAGFGIATRSDHRWLVEPAAAGGRLVVGRSVREENHGIRGFLVVLLATGAVVVLAALGGGFLLVSRVLAPARQIARTAQRLSSANLGERIPVDRVPVELREVATALNASFGRLDEAFAVQAAFTADASHELRTPLAILRAHLELAGAAAPAVPAVPAGAATAAAHPPGELRERLAICQEAAQRLEGIVASLLTLARADAGQLPCEQREVDLAPLVEAEALAFSPLARRRGIAIECAASPVRVRGDGGRLREVVGNLIDNAIRYNRDGGRVTIAVGPEGGWAVLRVADTGIGIAAEHAERIFERFFRVDPARSRSHGGSGLGLAIVKWIVERHGGSIAAAGRPGGGAEFVVRLPLDRSPSS